MIGLIKKPVINIRKSRLKKKFGFMADTAYVSRKVHIVGSKNVFLYDKAVIRQNAIIHAGSAKFIMKKYSSSASGLVVSTGTHLSVVGCWRRDITEAKKRELDPQNNSSGDVVVEEEVWLATNVVLMPGVVVGRGSAVGAGSVLRRSVPPYSTVMGNPARVVGFRFTPEQIIEHEKALYPEEERLPLELLEKNYKKYFLDRRMEIIKYLQV